MSLQIDRHTGESQYPEKYYWVPHPAFPPEGEGDTGAGLD